jgi:hypothetical protein
MSIQKIPGLNAFAAIFLLSSGFLVNGCALLAAPAVGELGSVGSAAGSTGSGISGLLSAESTKKVNNSWVNNNDAQASYYHQQTMSDSRDYRQEMNQRAASVGILESMARLDKDPQIADLATWVKAGGDPKFALNYALEQDKRDGARKRVVAMLESMSERDDDPALYELARWVRAGGNEEFALNYALNKTQREPARVKPGASRSLLSFSQGGPR